MIQPPREPCRLCVCIIRYEGFISHQEGIAMPFRRFLLLFAVAVITTSVATQDKYKSGPPPAQQDLKYKTDLEFAKFLQKDWQKTIVVPGVKADEVPKPVNVPVADVPASEVAKMNKVFQKSRPLQPAPQPILPPPETLPEPEVKPEAPAPVAVPEPEKEPEPAPAPEPSRPVNITTLSFTFCGAPLEMDVDPKLKVYVGSRVDNRSISEYWERMSQANTEDFLKQAQFSKKHMNLNDWGYGYLLFKIGGNLYPQSVNAATLFTWYMLVKSGYDARVGYGGNNVFLLLPSNNVWYEVSHFKIENRKYYLANFGEKRSEPNTLYIYNESYPGANKPVEVRMDQPPNISRSAEDRELKFFYNGTEYIIPAKYNKTDIDFFARYPQTDLDVYFRSAVSQEASRSLTEALKKAIAGKSEAEAVNILLRFVQTGFSYKTDDEQFGYEKYFFPEEILFYANCDCEDRSIFFAYLVKNLTGLEVIGLDYPGHVATAVRFSDDLSGDFVSYQGEKYLICDPTYINANIGSCMPRYKNVQPQIIAT